MPGSENIISEKPSVWKKVRKYKYYIFIIFINVAIVTMWGGITLGYKVMDKCERKCIDSRISCEKNTCDSNRDICLSKCSPNDKKCNSTCQSTMGRCYVSCGSEQSKCHDSC
ncbi:hypothetical protein CONCODRAFT_80740 [Conidiobolus coronatus NRRL 28638]|uniref:Uncharacterized protein n=1 Tax=Conidiobolus coronatus (strain ATCC 28846 / CBS 209.66 / NRRL 28638) TaxID=796925 RepID=A0A137NS96_CONC2|nr:hypothetical protein CONCODRAFT_80740 [Conidiobolus coronatus NRRL 28638]|eukprot:KXN65560.1 hypothetical protein CONCODRAFT_80740 [Conidiobolus coronatus NRRL 28638]